MAKYGPTRIYKQDGCLYIIPDGVVEATDDFPTPSYPGFATRGDYLEVYDYMNFYERKVVAQILITEVKDQAGALVGNKQDVRNYMAIQIAP